MTNKNTQACAEAFLLVTSVVQTWNTLLEDLEKIDVAIEGYLNEEER